MPKPDLAYMLGLPPEDAIAYLEGKGYAIGWSWRDVWQEASAKAFTAAGVTKMDVLADIKGGLVDALKNGETPQTFARKLAPLLERKGWWGKAAQIDPETGEMTGKGLTPRRLATIFDTNIQSAYMAGRYKAFMGNVADRPFWEYVAVMDRRTRPAHAALNGRVFRFDDPVWGTSFPPNGYRCRCSVRALDAQDVKDRSIDLSSSEGRLSDIDVPTSMRPDAPTATVTRFEYAPGKYFAPDPGFNFNAGREWAKPFTPPPRGSLPRSFPQGIALPELHTPARVPASALLPDGLPPKDYAKAFLARFGADLETPVVFADVTGAPLAVSVDLFKDGAGAWKATKDGRGPFMGLLADSVREPDEVWLRWEASRDQPGAFRLKRRYIKSWLIEGDRGPQHGLSVFEFGKDGWSGSTTMLSQADRSPEARRRYIEKQRDGFLAYVRK